MINKKGKEREFFEALPIYTDVLFITKTHNKKNSLSLVLLCVFVKSNNGRLEEEDTD